MHELTETQRLCAYVTLFAPLGATVIITLFTLKSRTISGLLALASIVAGLVCTVVLAKDAFRHEVPSRTRSWLSVGGITLKFGVMVDALGADVARRDRRGSCIFLYRGLHARRGGLQPLLRACRSSRSRCSASSSRTSADVHLLGTGRRLGYSLIGFTSRSPRRWTPARRRSSPTASATWDDGGILLLFFTLAKAGISTRSRSPNSRRSSTTRG